METEENEIGGAGIGIREEEEREREMESLFSKVESNLPKREVQGQINCKRKMTAIAIMRCGEYQQEGCKCTTMATAREIEFLKLAMTFRDRKDFVEPEDGLVRKKRERKEGDKNETRN